MDLTAVAQELQPAARRIARFQHAPLHRAWFRRFAHGLARTLPTGADLTGVRREVRPGGLRVFRPEQRRHSAALLWIHGGGLVLGSARMDDRFCAATARELGIVVASVEYRRAPQHPFPAALDDCLAAWTWLAATEGPRIAVGGQSAGGGLAAALTQRLHDADGADPVAQLLFCPMLDDRTAARRDLDAADHLMWHNRDNLFGWSSYLGREPGTPDLPPYAVPARRTDLTGLPPTWIGVGDIDLFHDEDRDYADRLTAAGVDTTFVLVPGAPHAFESWAPKTALAGSHLAGARDWLLARLVATS
jgi:acetyl esterase/lipase